MSMPNYPPKRILVPTDGSEASKKALQVAGMVQQRHGTELEVMHAFHLDLPMYFSSGQVDDLMREMQRARRAASQHLRRETAAVLGFEPNLHLSDNHPVEAILEESVRLGADLVVMGTHGRRGAERFRLGSVAERVLRRSPVPVLALRETAPVGPFRHVFCPFNFSPAGRIALEYAAQIAETEDGRLTIMHAQEEGKEPLDCALVEEPIRKRCRIEEVIIGGEAAETILKASHGVKPDVIVMGGVRRTVVLGDLFSSTTERVMQLAEAPLLLVPAARAQT